MKTYWHFAKIDNQGRPVMRDGTLIEIGKEYAVDKAVLCESGFHGSEKALDALGYAPGPWVSKRIITGEIVQGDDKLCGTQCVHTAGFDATDILRRFARKCALDVIHLWDAPQVVIDYLKTADESLRDVAWAAARAASWDAARAATKDAAWAAAREKQNRRLTAWLREKMREAVK